MSRSTFAGGANDYTFTPFPFAGHKLVDLVGGTLTVWSAETAGTQYTDLLLAAAAVTSIPVGSDGQVPAFQGPDGVTVVWVDGGGGRIRMVDVETLASTAVAAAADIDAAVTVAVANLVGGAPGALDTLNELAAALGDDAAFATTVTNALALKQDAAALDADTSALVDDTGSDTNASLNNAIGSRLDTDVPPAVTAALALDATAAAAVAAAAETAVAAELEAEGVATYAIAGYQTPAAIVTDATTRADSTTNAGSADTGQAYTVGGAGGQLWGVSGNKIVLVANGTGLRSLYLDAGRSGLRWGADVTVGFEAGLVAAAIDGSNYLAAIIGTSGNLKIKSYLNVVETVRETVSLGVTITAGSTHRLETLIEGDSTAATLKVYLDGVLNHTHTLVSADRARFLTTTKYGFEASSFHQNNKFTAISGETGILASDRQLVEWAAGEAYQELTATRDSDGFVTAATIKWPDNSLGTYTLVTKYSGAGILDVDAYTLTYPPGARLVTQAASTRSATTGAPTTTPALTVGAI